MTMLQLEKARVAYHKSCQREQAALDKEKQANDNAETSPEKKQKITEAKVKVHECANIIVIQKIQGLLGRSTPT
ncbi:hypothetical protein JOB18_048605 [Solea senegalensis]|uniref:Flotillin n=1 Tax=Solea senegalensis TaxID=28829 RepID=A0AAV6RR94_SOLSE|nr:hypothetical protein JOB18_048605 [Solea senegalensis]